MGLRKSTALKEEATLPTRIQGCRFDSGGVADENHGYPSMSVPQIHRRHPWVWLSHPTQAPS